MPRDLPLGNGDLLVTFDSRYQLRDIYFPQVGLENHTGGEPCRFGVWADGRFAWTGDDGWERDLRYAHETLVSEVTLGHDALGLRIRCRDTVDFDRNLYLKEVTVEDVTGRDRDVRLFQHFDAHLYGNDIGDSAFYDPRTRAVVHYKGRRYFLMTGVNAKGESGLTSFAIGLKEALGREGTWRDAEDGELSRNLVAQGSIDSVGMLGLRVPANALATATFVIAAGQTYDEVRDLDKLVRERGVGSFISRTGDYWNLWANKDETIADHLPDPLIHLYKQSTLVIRTQVDNRGAIIAGNDSDVLRFNRDTYSYLWPRDGALVAHALDLAGYGEVTRRFFYLCGELMTRDGYLLHKYNPDGSLGSSWHAWSTPDGRLELPIQEDETGLPLWALWQHYDRDRDIEFVRPLYRKLVRTGADFMSSYREPRTKLPAPSFDLWEERRGIHAFTTAAVWAGLSAARDFAAAFGQHDLSKRYGTAAEEIKTAALTHLYDDERGRFVRTVTVLPGWHDREGRDPGHVDGRDLPLRHAARGRSPRRRDDAGARGAALGEDGDRRVRPLRERQLLPAVAGHRERPRQPMVRRDALGRGASHRRREVHRRPRPAAGAPRMVRDEGEPLRSARRAGAPAHRRPDVGRAAHVVARGIRRRGPAIRAHVASPEGQAPRPGEERR